VLHACELGGRKGLRIGIGACGGFDLFRCHRSHRASIRPRLGCFA
jgi:hypothetical protein